METKDGYSHVVDEKISQLDNLVVPIVDEHLKPKTGMTFGNLEDAKKFYRNYGKAGGFNIHNSTTNYGKDRELICKSYVCSKEGVLKSKSLKIRRCGTIRTNCKALIRLKLDKNIGIWSVYKFVEEHNHTITSPSRTHFLRGNREVTSAKKTLIKQFGEVNIPKNKQMTFFENSSGGFYRIGCIETDVRNYERDLREERRDHDVQMMLDHFKLEQEKNPLFYYVYEVDEEKRLTHYFWVHGIARMNYQHFGDVVSFDATHNTNQYGLVFVPKRVVLRDDNIIGDNATINFASRFSELNCLANEMVEEIGQDVDAINKVQCLKLINDEEIGQDVEAPYSHAECSQDIVHEPSQARTKGRPKGKRLKPLREIRKCRPRKCKLCGKQRQNHDSRNCPLKLSR
ncbi:protein FAR1-RELATED SEQUENCE 5-like [Asparagus officinalis]|uniref:protein FAR1-RELATED SEQUENCE 5-like n=1 Tax=Asparagus officinalis TaxID=4686 RepID=UPI00098E0BDA|nr:protein FAR1-RELATED SEQUENCE 5-like [Asparagus officinalis]